MKAAAKAESAHSQEDMGVGGPCSRFSCMRRKDGVQPDTANSPDTTSSSLSKAPLSPYESSRYTSLRNQQRPNNDKDISQLCKGERILSETPQTLKKSKSAAYLHRLIFDEKMLSEDGLLLTKGIIQAGPNMQELPIGRSQGTRSICSDSQVTMCAGSFALHFAPKCFL